VLELVEGETLAARVARGALPVSEALALARQIVDALEAAHERGIVHRDLKPANIMLSADGDAKVLDFGLAKADASDSARSSSLTNSPTLTFAATQAGVILGTTAYMSPEQAKGRPADKRSDVWAFGCVLFEMVAGKRAFDGDDASDTLAAVLRGQPDWTALPLDLPPHIRTLIARCLEKDRKARIGDVSVARFLLDDGAALATASTTALPRAGALDRGWRPAVPWALTGVLTVALISVLVVLVPWRVVPRSVMRVSADLGVDASLDTSRGANIALSPDGWTLAFTGAKGNTAQLYIRPLDQPQAAALSGTDGAASPFFSPDSRWVGFFSRCSAVCGVAHGNARVFFGAYDERSGSDPLDGPRREDDAAARDGFKLEQSADCARRTTSRDGNS
jgi:serine/threonine-protein kinase